MKIQYQHITGTVKAWSENLLVRQYGKGVLWMLFARVFWILSSFVVGIYVARNLGPYNFGILNSAIAFVGLFSLFVTLCVDDIVVRQLVHMPEKQDEIIGNFVVFRTLFFIIMMAALVITLFFSGQTNQMKKMCFIIALGYIGYITQPFYIYFTAMVQNKYCALSIIVAVSVLCLGRLIAVIYNLSLYWFAWAEAISIIAGGIANLYFYWKYVDHPWRLKFTFHGVLALFTPAFFLALTGSIASIYVRINLIMVEHFKGPEFAGYFTISGYITEHIFMLGKITCSVFFPAVVSASKISDGAYTKQLHRLYFLSFWVMVAAALFTVLCGAFAIELLYGEAYLPSIDVLYIFICTLPLMLTLTVFGAWAVNENLLKTYATVLISGILLNIVLNCYAIPKASMNGAAFSSLISIPLGLIICLIFFKKGRKHLLLIVKSIFTLPSVKLGEHQ